jgi:hypothetical protein
MQHPSLAAGAIYADEGGQGNPHGPAFQQGCSSPESGESVCVELRYFGRDLYFARL